MQPVIIKYTTHSQGAPTLARSPYMGLDIIKVIVSASCCFLLPSPGRNMDGPWLLLQLACLDDHIEEVYPENRWPLEKLDADCLH